LRVTSPAHVVSVAEGVCRRSRRARPPRAHRGGGGRRAGGRGDSTGGCSAPAVPPSTSRG
jgi:hypothetical protein